MKDRYTYRYDYNSNRLYRKNELASSLSELYRASDTSGAGTTHYDGYDGLNRLAAFHRGVLNADGDGIASGLGRSEAFGLDGLGNWRTYGVDSDGNGTNDLDQTRVHNKVNEIDTTDDHGDAVGDAIAATTGSNWIDPVYDAAGNMTQGPQPENPLVSGTGETVRLHYAYDAWNRMTGVYADDQGQPGAAQCTYGYDGLHRQVWRTPVGMPAHYYYNESWQLLEEVYGLSTTQHVWDVRYIDAAVCSDGDGNHDGDCEDAATGVQGSNEGDWHQYYMQDANFNVTGLVDAYDGAVLQRYAYDPYGKPTVLHGVRDSQGTDTSASEWQVRTTFTLGNEFLYCGYRYDPIAGHYRVRYRVYHPTLGRWTARDPAGFEAGSLSLYGYAGCNPVVVTDPTGLIVFLVHGIDGTGWYSAAESAIKKVNPKEKVVKFKWGTYQPKVAIAFDADKIKINAFHLGNNPWNTTTKFFQSLVNGMVKIGAIKDKGFWQYEMDISATRPLLEPYPVGKHITMYLGGLELDKEIAAGQKLSEELKKAKREVSGNDCDIKVLAYSSGTRVLSWAMIFGLGQPRIKTSVLAGGSVWRWNPVIALSSDVTYNFYSDEDFITRHYPPYGGGAGSHGLVGAENKARPGTFHGDWMESWRIEKDYVPLLK